MRRSKFRVRGRLDKASVMQEGTVTIERGHDPMISVRVLRHRRVYELRLADVARAIIIQVLFSERQERRHAR